MSTDPTAIRLSFAILDACDHRDEEDGTCQHPANATPECHSGACPFTGPHAFQTPYPPVPDAADVPTDDKPAPTIVDLMEALEASLAAVKRGRDVSTERAFDALGPEAVV